MSSAPKVTLEQVEAAINHETYTVLPDGRTTVCQLTLYNGFTVEGTSACVSIENFDATLGNKYSRQRALDKVWMVLGFLLCEHLHTGKKTRECVAVQEESTFPDWTCTPPEIGASVAYTEVFENQVSPPMAAIVAGHNENGTVNLSVLAPNGTQHVRQAVPFHHEGLPYPPENHARYW